MNYIAIVGDERIVLPEGVRTPTDAQSLLKMTHPEVNNARIKTKKGGGEVVFEFSPKPGRKG